MTEDAAVHTLEAGGPVGLRGAAEQAAATRAAPAGGAHVALPCVAVILAAFAAGGAPAAAAVAGFAVVAAAVSGLREQPMEFVV